jgi:hypothetical protein
MRAIVRKTDLLIVLVAGVAGAGFAMVLPAPARAIAPDVVDEAANLPDPVAELKAAQQAAPFTIHLPDPPPAGAVPIVVDLLSEDGVASFDMWWTLPGSSRLHLWETNNGGLADEGKDVLANGTAVESGGVIWEETPVEWGDATMTELCRKLEDGVTVCVASDIRPASLRSIAATVS